MATQESLDLAQQMFVSYYGRPADPDGLAYWADQFDASADLTAALEGFGTSAEYDASFGSLTNEELVNNLYQQMFARDAEAAGIDWYVGLLEDGTETLATIAYTIGSAALNDAGVDGTVLNNKIAVSQTYTDAVTSMNSTYESDDIADAQAILDDVDETDASVTAGNAAAEAEVASNVVLPEGTSLQTTFISDNLTGTDGDDVFTAAVAQNETGSGELANTFETGDVLDGKVGQDKLVADLIATGTIQDNNQGAAIGATTTGIEEVYLTAITPQNDAANNTTFVSTIDAGRMDGVEQWWTDESRSNIRIEDVRTRPEDTTLGMRLTDPGVSYELYFNPLFMAGDQSSESVLTLRVQEITDGAAPAVNELANITVREINFELAGVSYTLDTEDMRDADTWAGLEAAIADALAEQAGLADLSIAHTGNGVFVIEDPEGGVFAVEDGEALIFGAAADIDVRNRVAVGRITEEGMTSSTLVLDGAGSGSRGGIVNIAAMSGDRGVEVLDVLVDRDSHITSLSSVNSPNTAGRSFDSENQLEEVYLKHVADGAQGEFQLGSRTQDTSGVSTTTDDRLATNGLTDVRIFDAAGFESEMKVGAQLTGDVFDKYLLGVSEPVQFSYLLGDGGSNLSLAVNNIVAGDPDFMLEVIGGAEADRINLAGLAVKENTSVDGGLGEDTMEITTTSGWAATQSGFDIFAAAGTDLRAAETSFNDVSNIETVVIASGAPRFNTGAIGQAAAQAAATLAQIGDTTHDIVAAGLADVDEFIIATDGSNTIITDGFGNVFNGVAAVNTRLINLNTDDQSVVISGKNQTLGAGNNDNNQNFGTVRFTDTTGEELDLQLANTARVSGGLTVATLTIDNQVGNVSEVRTLNLDSAGVRNTSNAITTLNGNLVNTFMLEGTQSLRITDLASAANDVAAAAADRDNLLVDGSGLGTFDENGDLVEAANLYLGVTGAVITNIDAALGTNRTVELIGTEGEADILNIRDGVITTNATTISEFETIRFGEGATITAATNFNATNVSDVELYDLVDSAVAGTINLNELRSTENVQINAGNTFTGSQIQADVTLAAANPTAGSQVDVNFTTNETTAGFVANFWQAGNANLNVQDFQTIGLDMGGTIGQSYDYSFNLNTLANPTTGDVNARTLEITGGLFDLNYLNTDSLTLNELDTALTKVDFSDYDGDFITNGWNSTQGSNAEVVVNEFGFQFDIGGDNTLFSVPAGVVAPALETLEFDFVTTPYGGLAAGDSIVITFAGGEYVFTNDTGALIADADLDNAIIADAANAPSAFNIAAGVTPDSVLLTATINGNMPDFVNDGVTFIEEETALGVVTDISGAGATVTANTDGDLAATNLGFEMVTVQSEFLTKFVFTQDAYTAGVVWQIDNFQPFDAVANVTLNTQTQLDLRQLGVDSSTKITIQDGATFLTSIDTDGSGVLDAPDDLFGAYTAQGNVALINALTAGDTFITSNDDLNFNILLTGVDTTNLGNENIVGIA